MRGINLHNVVCGAITCIHQDENCILYQTIGQVNKKGVITPKYNPPKNIRAQIQPMDSKTLQHLERVNDTKSTMQAYLYSNTDMPVTAGMRLPFARSGDIILRDDGTYWLITSVVEDWSRSGWAKVGITQQVNPPDFSESEGASREDT